MERRRVTSHQLTDIELITPPGTPHAGGARFGALHDHIETRPATACSIVPLVHRLGSLQQAHHLTRIEQTSAALTVAHTQAQRQKDTICVNFTSSALPGIGESGVRMRWSLYTMNRSLNG